MLNLWESGVLEFLFQNNTDCNHLSDYDLVSSLTSVYVLVSLSTISLVIVMPLSRSANIVEPKTVGSFGWLSMIWNLSRKDFSNAFCAW